MNLKCNMLKLLAITELIQDAFPKTRHKKSPLTPQQDFFQQIISTNSGLSHL
jgi:uncharacterized membrane protein